MDREQLDQLAAALANGRDTIRGGAREIADATNESLPAWANPAMRMASTLLPGPGAMDSMRLSSEAVGHFGEGRWGSGLETMGDAILAPVNDAMFLLPGGGFVRALPK